MREAGLPRDALSSQCSTGLREALEPLLHEIESLNERIKEYDQRIAKMGQTDVSGNGFAETG